MSVIMFNCIDLNSVCTASWANHLAVMQLLCCFFLDFIFILVIINNINFFNMSYLKCTLALSKSKLHIANNALICE